MCEKRRISDVLPLRIRRAHTIIVAEIAEYANAQRKIGAIRIGSKEEHMTPTLLIGAELIV